MIPVTCFLTIIGPRIGRILPLFTIFILFTPYSFSQTARSLESAERAFAKTSLQEGIRKAFIQNLDSNGVVFYGGKILNGMQVFADVQNTGSALVWKPEFVCTSTAGDIGFTTGPYEERDSNNVIISSGQYHSIWKKNEQGIWKLLVDIGTDYTPSRYARVKTVYYFTEIIPPESEFSAFSMAIEPDRTSDFFSSRDFERRGIFSLSGYKPFLKRSIPKRIFKKYRTSGMYKISESGESVTGDFVYRYGYFLSGNLSGNFLQIWVHTHQGWKILLHVIR